VATNLLYNPVEKFIYCSLNGSACSAHRPMQPCTRGSSCLHTCFNVDLLPAQSISSRFCARLQGCAAEVNDP
jgi:hypothetical protein